MTSKLSLWVDDRFDSPWAFSAFVALAEKEIASELRTVSLAKGEHRLPSFQAGTGRIPAMQRGSYWLAESVAIAEYAAENFPFPSHPRIFPENLDERGVCREVQGWLRTDLTALRQERSASTLWGAKATAPLSPQARAEAQKLIAYASAHVKPGASSMFAQWCIADADLALALQRLALNGDEVPEALKAYAAAVWSRPSAQRWHALKRE